MSRPMAGGVEPETTQEVDANRNLQPEDSRNFSAGFVYTPKWIKNWQPNATLTLSVDFWDVERTGVVTVPSAQSLVTYSSKPRSVACRQATQLISTRLPTRPISSRVNLRTPGGRERVVLTFHFSISSRPPTGAPLPGAMTGPIWIPSSSS